jgi:hypothetical protein
MTPKEKAQYLVDKFTPHAYGVWDKNGSKEERYHSKQCALIAVDNIITSNPHSNPLNTEVHSTMQYWIDVKTEIKKL